MSAAEVTPFYLRNFRTTGPGTDTPVSEFRLGAAIEFRWDSNGTEFTVYAAHDPAPVYQGRNQGFSLPGGRSRNTTFIIAASVTGGLASGRPEPEFTTIYLYDALTVTISDPAITPGSLTAGTLDVTGALTATGTSTTTLGAVTAGSITVTKSVTMLNSQAVQPGMYYGSSDGLVIGTVGWPNDPAKKCSATVFATSAGVDRVQATGGNHVLWSQDTGLVAAGQANSFTLPVRGGIPWTVGVTQIDGREVDAPVSFTWVSFGQNATLHRLSEQEAEELGLAETEESHPQAAVPNYDPEPAIAEVIAILTEALGDDVAEESVEQFSRALRALATHRPC